MQRETGTPQHTGYESKSPNNQEKKETGQMFEDLLANRQKVFLIVAERTVTSSAPQW